LFAHERAADSIEHAQSLSRTRFFWWVSYLCDYSAWDWFYEPVPWQAHQRHAWLDQYHIDAGVYLVPTIGYAETNYHAERQVHRLPNIDYWHIPKWIDPASVDFRWAPNPTDPPYIYEFPVEWDWDRVGGPEYRIPGATDRKYMDAFVTRTQSDRDMWKVYDNVFDTAAVFNWHPNPFDPPMIYVFGNQHWPAEVRASVEYHVPGAVVKKYMDNIRTVRLPDPSKFICLYPCEFDWSWEPNPGDPPYIYVWGNQWWPAEKMPTVEYHVAGATERKYMDQPARIKPAYKNWLVPDTVDCNSIDFSWRPDPGDAPYIYEFATQWQPNGGAVYIVPGATERKYVEIQHRRLPDKQAFTKLEVVQGFDYSWHPDNTEEPYNYVFGNQHWPGTEMPTLVYKMSNATQEKFVDGVVARLASNMGNWELHEDIDQDTWDWTWVPNPKDPPYTYVFGNQWNPPEFKASIRYVAPGATEFKYIERRTRRLPNPKLFRHNLAVSKFDYSWEPNPFDPPMTYVFGNQWNSAVLEPTVVYNAGGNEIKYVDDIIATVAQDVGAWELLDDIESFDYSWRPNPTDPPYIYVFGNQWLTPEQRPALKYCVADATNIKYMDHPRAQRRGDHTRFVQHYPASFDWSWEPEPGSPPYNYVFGNQYYSAEVMPTIEYRMSGATERNYMDISAQLLPHHSNHWHTLVDCEWDYTWRPEPGSPPYIYVFGNQWWSAEKMPTLEYHMEGATERKYMQGPLSTLLVDMTNWSIPKHIDLTDMDFSWLPDPGEPPYIYQFATQHQKTGGPQYRMPDATEFKYVDMMRAEVKKEAAPVFEIDHLDGAAGQIPDVVKKVRYFDNYRDTLIRLAKSLVGEYEHVWVCSSICDYSNFDFTWHPETWQSTMLHVFASDKEKFGDTFYMHVPTFAERAEKKQLLEWYSVNYVPRKSVPRRPMPMIQHTADSHVDAVKTTTWAGPLATFTTTDSGPVSTVTVPLWRKETKTIVPLSAGASSVIVPRVAVSHIKTQLYDYPYIDKSYRGTSNAMVQDVVFISYDEPDADQNWKILKDHCPRAVRVHGVSGMELALEAAADVSTTPWFFAVFAKTQLHKGFDFSVVPDRMQLPKHYIFNCRNASNNLEYGHMGVVLYNCQGVRNINRAGNFGLDYTLSFPHESVPLLSCYGDFATTPYHAWRTAFRETAKLAYFEQTQPSVDNHYRLGIWLTHAEGNHADWVLKGANDGNEFYKTTNSDLTTLKQSFRWEWLREYFVSKYSSELK